MPRFAFVVILLGLFAGIVRGQDVRARVEMLADVTQVKAGEPFTVGFHFRMDPAWHIYWSNPGPAGIATRIQWTLPEGVSAGPLRFPVPMRFVQPGDIVGYGYENEVLILAELTPQADLDVSELRIAAEAAWLCCADICIPGREKLELTLPVGESAQPANRELFEQWRQRLPRDVQQGSAADPDYVRQVDVSDEPAGESGRRVRIAVGWKTPPKQVEFYPGGHRALEVVDIEVKPTGEGADAGTQVQATVQPLPGQKQWPAELEGVLVYQTDSGQRRGLRIPMATPAPPAAVQAGQ